MNWVALHGEDVSAGFYDEASETLFIRLSFGKVVKYRPVSDCHSISFLDGEYKNGKDVDLFYLNCIKNIFKQVQD